MHSILVFFNLNSLSRKGTLSSIYGDLPCVIFLVITITKRLRLSEDPDGGLYRTLLNCSWRSVFVCLTLSPPQPTSSRQVSCCTLTSSDLPYASAVQCKTVSLQMWLRMTTGGSQKYFQNKSFCDKQPKCKDMQMKVGGRKERTKRKKERMFWYILLFKVVVLERTPLTYLQPAVVVKRLRASLTNNSFCLHEVFTNMSVSTVCAPVMT